MKTNSTRQPLFTPISYHVTAETPQEANALRLVGEKARVIASLTSEVPAERESIFTFLTGLHNAIVGRDDFPKFVPIPLPSKSAACRYEPRTRIGDGRLMAPYRRLLAPLLDAVPSDVVRISTWGLAERLGQTPATPTVKHAERTAVYRTLTNWRHIGKSLVRRA